MTEEYESTCGEHVEVRGTWRAFGSDDMKKKRTERERERKTAAQWRAP
jgi:hypothetical protein